MTANVRIVTDTRDSVLKAPNGALRFRPAGTAADAPKAAEAAVKSPGNSGAAGGSPMTQFRERLVAELKLDAEQQQRLEPVFTEARNKFMGLRELPEEARAKAGAAIRADLRTKVEEVLKPEQKARYAEIAAEFAGRAGGGQAARGRLWVMDGGKPRSIEVRVGLSDGAMTEVSGDGITEGLEVIVGQQGGSTTAPAQKGAPPRMFF
jgi:HlyD family secretion protein